MKSLHRLKTHEQKAHFCERLLNTQQPVLIEIKPYKKTRSTAQNALYWMWLTEMRDHIREVTGDIFTTDDIHEAMAERFLPVVTKEVLGKSITRRVSTTKLNTQEFSDYLHNIDMYCADELELLLTHPDDYNETVRGETF